MEVSGVNRLLSLARELGVQPATRSRNEPRVDARSGSAIEGRGAEQDAGGIRVSLSAESSAQPSERLTNASPQNADAQSPRPTRPAEAAPAAAPAAAPRQQRAISAYAKTAAGATGEHIRLRA